MLKAQHFNLKCYSPPPIVQLLLGWVECNLMNIHGHLLNIVWDVPADEQFNSILHHFVSASLRTNPSEKHLSTIFKMQYTKRLILSPRYQSSPSQVLEHETIFFCRKLRWTAVSIATSRKHTSAPTCKWSVSSSRIGNYYWLILD